MSQSKHLLFLVLTVLLLGLFSCDYVEFPLEEKSGVFDGDKCPEPTFPANTNTKRNILFEDFTGHTCVGCPGAAYELEQLEATYGDQIIGIAIHSGFFAQPQPGAGKFETDFRSDDGNDIHDDFTPSAYPQALINRSDTVINNGSYLFSKAQFNNAASRFINNAPLANLQLITTFDNSDRTLCVFNETEALSNLTGNFSLVIALTEDSIVDWQKNGGSGAGSPDYPYNSDVQNYIHNHVFRGNVNGTYGEEIISGSITSGEKIISKYTFELDPSWDETHVNVIAYLFDQSTKEVLQVIKVHAGE